MTLVCKCCGANAVHLGSVDFNKSCMDRPGSRVFPPSETLVPYFACQRCGFVFTNFMDAWSPNDFITRIYNDEYRKADPLLLVSGGTSVPKDTIAYHNGLRLASLLQGAERDIRVLDFGAGGNPGITGQALLDRGFQLDSYEPHLPGGCPEPTGVYDLIVLIEVIEHCHDLHDVMRKIAARLSDTGLVYVTTALHPANPDANTLSSWYISPRNGHISIFSFPAICVLFRRFGLNFVQTLNGMVAFRGKPSFKNEFLI
jgi:2-polyprenyl-6-hydroxyphenyl methylase/3-demethylubiquinone-9 3-methyltransferase